MKTKISVAAAATLFAVGALSQLWIPQLGLTAMLLAIMCGLAVVVLRQQALLRRLSRQERVLLQVQKTAANAKTETVTYGGSILRRVKMLTDEVEGSRAGPNPSPAAQQVGGQTATPAASNEQHGAGRVATPEVSNPLTNESLHSMLTPGRVVKVAGVFSPRTIPEGEASPWVPGDVFASLERERPDVLLIDERELQDSSRWSSATSGAGTGLMRELLDGIRWAKARGIPVFLLPSTLAADVHSAALRAAPVLVLPLDVDAMEAAAGGPQTRLLHSLHEIAVARESEAP